MSQNKFFSHQKKRKTALTLSIITCLFMGVMGYEISRNTTQATETNLTQEEWNENNLKYWDQESIKELILQNSNYLQTINKMKSELADAQHQLHLYKVTLFPTNYSSDHTKLTLASELLAEKQKTNDNLKKDIADLEKKLEISHLALEELKGYEELQKQFNQIEEEYATLINSQKEKENHHYLLGAEAQTLAEKLSQLQESMKNQEIAFAIKQFELNSALHFFRELNSSYHAVIHHGNLAFDQKNQQLKSLQEQLQNAFSSQDELLQTKNELKELKRHLVKEQNVFKDLEKDFIELNAQLNQKVTELENRLKKETLTSSQKENGYTQNIEKLNQEIAKLNQEIEKIQSQSIDKIAHLEGELSKLETLLHSKHEELDKMASAHASAHEDIKGQVDHLASLLKNEKSAKSQLHLEFKELKRQYLSDQNIYSDIEKNLKEQNLELAEKLVQLQNESTKHLSNLTEKEDQITKLNDKIEALQSEMTLQQSEHQKKIASQAQKLEELSDYANHLSASLKVKQSINDQSKELNKKYLAEQKMYKEIEQNLKESNKELNEKISELENRLEEKATYIAQKEKEFQEKYQIPQTTHQNEVNRLMTELSQLYAYYEHSQGEAENFKKAVAKAEEKVNDIQLESRKNIHETRLELTAAQKEYESLQNDYQNLVAENQELKVASIRAAEEAETQSRLLKEVSKELLRQKERLSILEKSREELTKEMEQLNKQ